MRFDYWFGAGREFDRQTYEDAGTVAAYGRENGLQPAEERIVEHFGLSLAAMDMLDLGVGAGRTAAVFATKVKSYIGVDYSQGMIAHCRQRLPGLDFRVQDARALDFPDGSFDLVLFSYNGVDHLYAADRETAFREMNRVLRPGGRLVFSSHNTNFIPYTIKMFRPRLGPTIRETLRSVKWAMVFEFRNPLLRFRLPMVEGRIVDGVHGFRTSGYHYVRPDRQVESLQVLGFEPLFCVGNNSSEIIAADCASLATLASPWVYYVSRKPSGG